MEMVRMNNPKQIRFIYQVLKDGVGSRYRDIELLEYASALNELFNEEYEDGYDYQPCFDEPNTKDAFSLMSSDEGELMFEERELLDSVYEFESDEFITNKPWKNKYFGGGYEC
jgi:hypothetical protein